VEREKAGTRNPENVKRKQTLQKLNDKKKHKSNGAFTACTAVTSLLETVTDAAEIAAQVAMVLLSTARSSFDEFQNARKCGEKLYNLVKSISWGRLRVTPNISGGITAH
jgi:UDP-N-acetylmuramoylalanine-D-glutamate ligase